MVPKVGLLYWNTPRHPKLSVSVDKFGVKIKFFDWKTFWIPGKNSIYLICKITIISTSWRFRYFTVYKITVCQLFWDNIEEDAEESADQNSEANGDEADDNRIVCIEKLSVVSINICSFIVNASYQPVD